MPTEHTKLASDILKNNGFEPVGISFFIPYKPDGIEGKLFAHVKFNGNVKFNFASTQLNRELRPEVSFKFEVEFDNLEQYLKLSL